MAAGCMASDTPMAYSPPRWTKKPRTWLLAAPALALALCIVAGLATRGAMQNLPFVKDGANPHNRKLVDQSPWLTAQALGALAVTDPEKEMARQAERLSDHEVDQAFAMALRQAADQAHPLAGKALALQQRVTQLRQTVKDDQARVDALTAQAGKPAAAAPAQGDDLAVAKAQLGLDTDILNDAVNDLQRESGDQRALIQQELTAREATMKKYDAQAAADGQTVAVVERQRGTLYRRLSGWFDQRSRARLIDEARQETLSSASLLAQQHKALQAAARSEEAAGPAASLTGAARVKALQAMGSRRKIMSILDDRMDTLQQLAATYASWSAQVNLQHRIVLHLMFQSFTWIAFIVFCTVLASWTFRRILDRVSSNSRQKRTLRAIIDLGIQLVALVLILLVTFGAPRQMPTILGLLTAGLTVVFQDFILAFFGWFVIIGKNGIRVGDWVEINGVGGEVMEIGLFRTALLETGNWTANGHPTGRRTTFINSYAIRGQFFNFSTAGQWMWDEIRLNLPLGEQTPQLIDKILAVVAKTTAADTTAAEEEWLRVTQRNGLLHFGAQPTVDMRPASSGVDIIVRYVTRAGGRLEMRNRLYKEVVRLLQEPSQPASPGLTPELANASADLDI